MCSLTKEQEDRLRQKTEDKTFKFTYISDAAVLTSNIILFLFSTLSGAKPEWTRHVWLLHQAQPSSRLTKSMQRATVSKQAAKRGSLLWKPQKTLAFSQKTKIRQNRKERQFQNRVGHWRHAVRPYTGGSETRPPAEHQHYYQLCAKCLILSNWFYYVQRFLNKVACWLTNAAFIIISTNGTKWIINH